MITTRKQTGGPYYTMYFFSHFHFPASVVPSPPRLLPSIFIAHRVQQSHCSSIFHQVLLAHALAPSASQFVHKKKSQRINTSMHSAGLELTKLTYTRLEDNLIRHRGDPIPHPSGKHVVNPTITTRFPPPRICTGLQATNFRPVVFGQLQKWCTSS